MTLALEHHCLDLRYAALRTTSRSKERRLLASLAENGQLAPVIVVASAHPHRYVLIDGYKRARALKRLQSDVVQAMLWEVEEPDALICERLLLRSDGEGALEQGWLLQELQQRFNLNHAELARRFDVSESWVSRRLALVQQLPESIHEAVRAGRVVAHAAQKYLVPLARANREHAMKLSAAIGNLSLSSRQIGSLYVAYQQADDDGKELIVTRPELAVRAQQEVDAQHQKSHPDPAEQLEHDVHVLVGAARRVQRNLQEDLIKRLPSEQRQRLKLAIEQTAIDIRTIQATLNKEFPPHA
jgi:ParB family chromosome partitioning protein